MDTKVSITKANNDAVHRLATVEVAFPDGESGVVYNTIKFSFRMAWNSTEETNAEKQRAIAIAKELAQQFAGSATQ